METTQKKKVKAVVFDMDGVIFDSEKIYRKNNYIMAERYGLPMEKVEEYSNRIAGGTKDTNKLHFEEMFGTDIDFMEFRKAVHDGVDQHAMEFGFEMKPGIKEFLAYLKERNIRIAMATSTAKDRAEHHLKSHGIFEYFEEIAYGNMVERGKPNPDIYLLACKMLGVEPTECAAVEDSINGVVSAHRAGLYTIMVVDLIQPNETAKECADFICDCITEAKERIE